MKLSIYRLLGQAGNDNVLVAWIFLRFIALIYFSAFASLAVQIKGLIGVDGILPASEYLTQVQQILGLGLWDIPTLFWLNSSDLALVLACWVGMAAALAVLFDHFNKIGLLLCYILYLSLVQVGQAFTTYQWDMFLLESGFLALFLTGGSPLAILLFRFLLFRFMLMGGVVKLASGDPAWSSLTALNYHFETQPLQSPLAWYAHQLPEVWLQSATVAVLFIELAVPFCVFMPRPFRMFAAVSFLVLQVSIMLTGSYNFFNLLTLGLCVFLLEDRDLHPWLGTRLSGQILDKSPQAGAVAQIGTGMMAVFVLTVCAALLWMTNTHQRPIQPVYGLAKFASTFALVNGYGPFAVMTTERHEIIVEGSDDGQTWLPYEFRYKPGELIKPLSWNIPHQPRLDWQMWFAALGDWRDNPWFLRFMGKLGEGSVPVLALLQSNPFPEHPPKFLRASFYRYRFTHWQEKSKNGQVWQRERLGQYLPFPY